MKCFEASKELGLKFPQIKEWLSDRGVAAKSHFHTLLPDEFAALKRDVLVGKLGKEAQEQAREKVRAAKAAAAAPPPEPPKPVAPPPEEEEDEPEAEPAPVAPVAPAAPGAPRPAQTIIGSRPDSRRAPIVPRPTVAGAGPRPARGGMKPAATGGFTPGSIPTPKAVSGARRDFPTISRTGPDGVRTTDRPDGAPRAPRQPLRDRFGRTFGDRNATPAPSERPARTGDRPARPGDRPARPGDRPARFGDRPARPGYGDRPARPGFGDRAARPGFGARPAPAAPALTPDKGSKFKGRTKAKDKAKSREAKQRKEKRGREQALLAPPPDPLGLPGGNGEKVWKGTIKITDPIVVGTLAEKMNEPVNGVIQMLIGLGVMVTRNQPVNADCATTVAEEFGWHTEVADLFEEEKRAITKTADKDDKHAVHRAPIVTVMGHVDHGKTMLLDAIRSANVVASESGGITQHIGAYRVKTAKGEIAFIDTPGHEAFGAMRARGAEVTDIVVLVVAANDGVKPQTVEAINHAKQARVPIIVAVNKVDLPEANLERVRQQLAEHELVSEAWGGKTIFVEVSAKMQQNIPQLLDMILLQAEMMDLKADPDVSAVGTVLESRLDPKLGPLATVMVQKGTLKPGQAFVSGIHSGRVRTMTDEHGQKLVKAGPSTPVAITGISGVPGAGDLFMVVANDREARARAARNAEMKQEADQKSQRGMSLADLQQQVQAGTLQTINLILKADVDGSLGAIRDLLGKFEHKEVALNWVHATTGGVTESDVNLAAASQAIIIAYRVQPTTAVRTLADKAGVEIRTYDIIYQVEDDLKKAMEGLLSPEIREAVIGTAEVRQVFRIGGLGNIAGCVVTDGKIRRSCKARLIRDSIKIWEGGISSLKHFKNDASEVPAGSDCGIGLLDYNDVKEGDRIEAVEVSQVAVKL